MFSGWPSSYLCNLYEEMHTYTVLPFVTQSLATPPPPLDYLDTKGYYRVMKGIGKVFQTGGHCYFYACT